MRTSYIVFEVDTLRRLNDVGLGKPKKLSVVVLAPEIVQSCQDFLQEHAKKY